jgi:iron complex outermembrane receptor protein
VTTGNFVLPYGVDTSFHFIPGQRAHAAAEAAAAAAAAADDDAQAAPALDSAPAAPGGNDIVVTARKRKESIVDTPLAVSAFTGDTLRERGVPSIHELDTLVPSLTVSNFGAGNVSDATCSSAASARPTI